MKITRFEDIEAWQLARDLTHRIYRLVQEPKFSKDYGLRDQISRASVSIMANIAEGFNAGSNAEFVRFLGYAQRSCTELQSHLYVALDQNYIGGEIFNEMYELVNKTSSKIGAFIKYLKQCKTKNYEPRTMNEEQ
jgi:four helix bundle protein